MRKWQMTLLVTIVFSIIALAGAGWSQRPIVDYEMAGLTDGYNTNYGLMLVSIKYRNRGNVDVPLKLVVTVTNANITVDKLEPWIEWNETQVKFNVAAISNRETFSYYEVKIYPFGNPQNFTITYTIEDQSNFWSINGMISRLFLEPHDYFPTYVQYSRTNTNVYQWLKEQ